MNSCGCAMNFNSRPFFSVVTPVYNGAVYIPGYVSCLLSQTFTDWEALIVNDGSTDDTASVLKSLCHSDSRFILMDMDVDYSASHFGPSSARNAALAALSGRYVCFLDIDDLWAPDKLERYWEILASSSECALLTSSYVRFREGDTFGRVRHPAWFRPYKMWMHVQNIVPMSSACVRSDVLENHSIAFDQCRHEDYVFWFRVVSVLDASSIQSTRLPLMGYRIRPNSLSSDKARALVWNYMCYRRFGYCRASSILLVSIKLLVMAASSLLENVAPVSCPAWLV